MKSHWILSKSNPRETSTSSLKFLIVGGEWVRRANKRIQLLYFGHLVHSIFPGFSPFSPSLHIFLIVVHKVLTYIVQSSVWRPPNYWHPTPSPPRECVLPPHQRRGGGTHSPGDEGVGGQFRKTPDNGFASYSIIPLRCGVNINPLHQSARISLGKGTRRVEDGNRRSENKYYSRR